ncbi:MAG: hypothetical protein ACLQBA_05970 [Candidatus Binataceae bacterium]
MALTAAISFAGDLYPQPADSLSVTNSATKLLPQTQAAEESWLTGLHVSGYVSQQFGMWQNPSALREWTSSRNNLAVSRTLLQVDENYRLNENNNFFAREWFVYEPPYAFNSSSATPYSSIQEQFRSPSCKSPGSGGCPTTSAAGAPATGNSWGHYTNDLYNQLLGPRFLVGEQDGSAHHLCRQPDRRLGTIVGLPRRRRHQSPGSGLELRLRQSRAVA